MVTMTTDISINTTFSSAELQRYARHFTLPEVGINGQKKIKNAKVLCVGVGGLGSPALLYLAAAGVGTLGLVDDDCVDISNLQRQIIFSVDDVGEKKVNVARDKLLALNPNVKINIFSQRLTKDNAFNIIDSYDIVIDCTDNFYSHYLINDACFFLQKPCVYASIACFEGQCSVFSSYLGPCYRCIFKNVPLAQLIPNCAEAGVIGALPGLLGSIQAMEAIKLILNQGNILIGRLLLVDALTMQFSELTISKNKDCPLCTHKIPFNQLVMPEISCNTRLMYNEISVYDLQKLKKQNENFFLLDVREQFEYDICHLNGNLIPVNILSQRINMLDPNQHIIIHCKTDVRSKKAAEILYHHGFKNVSILKGGIAAWISEIDSSLKKY